VLSLYKNLLKNGKKFADYNYREYTLRRTKEDFRKYKNETDKAKLDQLHKEGLESLQLVKRQATISQMYKSQQSFMEGQH
jgi:hypothetical protein